MSYAVLGLITNRAKQSFQESIRLGYGLQVTNFIVGSAGHDPDSPITALTPDPGYDPTQNSSGHRLPEDAITDPLAITSASDDPAFLTTFVCDLPRGTATGEVSSLYLLAKVVYPTSHSEYDLLWVWSVAYMPLNVKTDTETWSYNVGIAY